jgi:carboxypeptidase PM20D1
MSINEKKPLWLKVEAKAKTHGHSASETDLYAAKRLIKALIRILDYSRPVKFDKLSKRMFKDLGRMEGGFKGFLIKNSYKWYAWPIMKSYFNDGGPFNILVSNSITITEISTERNDVNSIPQSAYAILDCRLLPGTNEKLFLTRIRLLAGNKVNVSIIHSGIDADDSPINESFAMMEKALKHNFDNSKVVPFLFPASSDNNYFRALKIPVYGIVPMVTTDDIMQRIHNSNERMPINQLIKGYDTYFTMMKIVQGVFEE